MPSGLSPRLAAVVDALPLRPDSLVLEVGCGPGAAARAVAEQLDTGRILGIDRSAKAIAQALSLGADQIAAGRLAFRQVAVEHFAPQAGDEPFDLVFAVRVGALDGRHPRTGDQALRRLAAAVAPHGRLLVDGGDPLREILLPRG